MKKVVATILTMMVSQIAFAGEVYCGSNIETVPGSQVFNKPVFWEKANTANNTVRYLLADGTLLRGDELTPENLAKVTDGAVVMGYSFKEDKTHLFIGTIKRDQQNHINYTNLAMGIGATKGMSLLMAHGAALSCVER